MVEPVRILSLLIFWSFYIPGELACDYDYHISWGYKCIKVHITSVTWSDAMYSCLRENGTLLELRPPGSYKQADITQLLTSHKLTDMWIETRKHKSGYRSRSIVKDAAMTFRRLKTSMGLSSHDDQCVTAALNSQNTAELVIQSCKIRKPFVCEFSHQPDVKTKIISRAGTSVTLKYTPTTPMISLSKRRTKSGHKLSDHIIKSAFTHTKNHTKPNSYSISPSNIPSTNQSTGLLYQANSTSVKHSFYTISSTTEIQDKELNKELNKGLKIEKNTAITSPTPVKSSGAAVYVVLGILLIVMLVITLIIYIRYRKNENVILPEAPALHRTYPQRFALRAASLASLPLHNNNRIPT